MRPVSSSIVRPSPVPAGPRKPAHPKAVSFTIATVNDDFTDHKTNLRRVKADVVMVQEAKNTNIRDVRNPKHFGVLQNQRREDKGGSAIVWNKDQVEAGKRGYVNAVRPQGAAMLQRWISYTDVNVDGAKVRMVAVHRPPKRFSRLWPDFDRNLAAFAKKSPHPIVIGMDANQENPRRMAHLTGLRWHAPRGSIDGFLATRGIRFENLHRIAKGSSDHNPVLAKITVPGRLTK